MVPSRLMAAVSAQARNSSTLVVDCAKDEASWWVSQGCCR